MGLFGKAEKSEAQKYMEERKRKTGVQPGQSYVRKDAQTHTYVNGKKSHVSTQNKNTSRIDHDPALGKPNVVLKDMMSTIEAEMARVRNNIGNTSAQNSNQTNIDDVWHSTFDDDKFSARSTDKDRFTPKTAMGNNNKPGGITINGVRYENIKEAWKKSPGFKVLVIFVGGFFILPIVLEIFFAIISVIIMLLGGLLG